MKSGMTTNLTFNVAQLLREEIGSRRDYSFAERVLPLDESLTLRDIEGSVRFTRTASGVFAHIVARGVVRLVCVRSLEEFDQPVDLVVEDEFHSVVDVVSGGALPGPTEEDPFFLSDMHMADVGEVIREYTLIELPLRPVCEQYREQMVSYTVESGADDEETGQEDEMVIDKRLEILKTWSQQ